MALTTSNGLKALVEGLGTGLSAYRDQPPEGTKRPYVTITEEVVWAPDSMEDGKSDTVVETAQVSLWEDWHDLTTGNVAESYTLATILRRGLDGSRLPQVGSLLGTSLIYMTRVTGSLRLLDPTPNIVQHAFTVEVHRQV
jgi:hypothetical protein